ncbi:MAG TPA: hypothetical protein VHF58_05200 [Solirubrobacterales bacterium]|nr:hypothetical protein [Solirubrobacterales bacterium]
MSSVYELIGRLVVRLAWARYGRQLTIAGAIFGALILALGFVLAKRTPPEG